MERLTGKWDVRITSGPFWLRAMNWVGDRKVIYGNRGHNVMLWQKWGRFTIVPGSEIAGAADFSLKYDDGTIIDLVSFKDPNTLYGRLYMKDVEEWEFVGTFEMVRVR